MNRFFRRLLVGYTVIALGLAGCVSSDPAWDRVYETGELRVGMDASFPPFEFISAEQVVGLDVDLAKELARRLEADLEVEEVEVHFVVNLPYDGLYDALALDQVDVVISALVVNPSKTGEFAYVPYFDAGYVLVVREKQAQIETMSDLDGCTLAVEFGSRGDQEARRWLPRLMDFDLAQYQTAAEALASVKSGEADAALVDHTSALAEDSLTVVGEPVVSEPYAVAVRKDNVRLLRAIEKGLAAMAQDGTLDTLVAQWLRDHQ